MNKLEELEKSLKEYKDMLEKQMDAMGAEPIATQTAAPGVNSAMGKKEMKPAPEGSKNRESYEKEFGKKEHEDEKEDKKMVAEAMDDHNEKKHGEAKDKDSAYKDMKVKKADDCEMVVKFEKNGQWSMQKAETTDKIQRMAPGGRQEAKVTTAEGTKVMSPGDQMKAKQDKAMSNKAKAEAAAAERRSQYRKEGKLK